MFEQMKSKEMLNRTSPYIPGELAFPDHKPYIEFKLTSPGIAQISVITFLVSISILNISAPVRMSNVNNHKRTLYAIDNYKIFENGTKYYDYHDYETGEDFHSLLSEWFDKILKGKYMYMFGHAFENFCWPRQLVDEEWFPSLYRASQLKPLVQVPLRFAALLGFCFRFIQSLVIGFSKFSKTPTTKTKILMTAFTVNEIIHNICLFLITSMLVSPDKDYLFLSLPALTTSYMTFAFKMTASVWHLGIHSLTITRLLLCVVMCFTFETVQRTTQSFLEHPNCDDYVNLTEGAMEIVALFNCSRVHGSFSK